MVLYEKKCPKLSLCCPIVDKRGLSGRQLGVVSESDGKIEAFTFLPHKVMYLITTVI